MLYRVHTLGYRLQDTGHQALLTASKSVPVIIPGYRLSWHMPQGTGPIIWHMALGYKP